MGQQAERLRNTGRKPKLFRKDRIYISGALAIKTRFLVHHQRQRFRRLQARKRLWNTCAAFLDQKPYKSIAYRLLKKFDVVHMLTPRLLRSPRALGV